MYSDKESLRKIFSDAGFIDVGTGQYLSGRGVGDVGQAKAVVSAQQNNLINSIYTLGAQLSSAGINSQTSIKNNNLIFEYWDSKDPSSKETIIQPLSDMTTVGKNIENFVVTADMVKNRKNAEVVQLPKKDEQTKEISA